MKEFCKFILFFILLSFFSVFFTRVRIQDKEFLHADSGITLTDLEKLKTSGSFVSSYSDFVISLVTYREVLTASGENVRHHLLDRFLPTAYLALFSVFSGSFCGVFFSILAVYLKSEPLTAALKFLSVMILSTPVFVVSVILLLVFFLKLGILPPGGFNGWDLRYLLLPGIALGSRVFARIFLYSHSEVLLTLDSPYILFLRSRGFGEARILFKHVFLKIFPLLIILILVDLSSLLSGAIIVEEIFFFPGIGKSMYQGIKSMDENLLRFLLFYSGFIFYILIFLSKKIQTSVTGKLFN
ncbi:MAG: ABC transporter permease [Leptospira sp.]|nr:ABC transporter permease [Leptospira sp.]